MYRSIQERFKGVVVSTYTTRVHQNTLNRNHLIFESSRGPLYSLPLRQNDHVEEARPKKNSPFDRLSRPKKNSPFDQLSRPRKKSPFDVHIYFRGCCNGLVLLSAFSKRGQHRLIVLNPTTKDFLELPVCNCCFDSDSDHIHFERCFLYGFSYDSVIDDYKVVTIFFNKRIVYDVWHMRTVHVYSLRTNTWKQVIDFPYDFDLFYPGSSLSSVLVNGNIHWLAKNKGSGNYLPQIVAFSLADENTSQVPMPDTISASVFCTLVDLGGKLGIFRESECDVWLMNEYGVKESWTKISLHGIQEILTGKPTVIYMDGKILVIGRDLMLIYNVEEQSLWERKATSPEWKDLIAKAICVESLVSPKYWLTN